MAAGNVCNPRNCSCSRRCKGAVFAVHPLIVAAGDDVPEVVDHAVGDEHFAVFVPVEAPGVGGAVGEGFEHFPRRVVRARRRSPCRMRSFWGVPGLPTHDFVWMPLQPYSQPSGPQARLLKTLCLSLSGSSRRVRFPADRSVCRRLEWG